MCQHRVLLHNESGYIVQCQNCQHIQLGFGTSLIYMDEPRFDALEAELLYLVEKHEHTGFPKQKSIHLTTNSPQIYIILNYLELLQLNDMVQQARLILTAHRLLEESGNPNPNPDSYRDIGTE